MSFRALLVEKSEAGEVSANIREIDESQLPADGDVTVDVAYSTVNYKDGLCVNGLGGLVRNLSLIHISEPTRRRDSSSMPSSA